MAATREAKMDSVERWELWLKWCVVELLGLVMGYFVSEQINTRLFPYPNWVELNVYLVPQWSIITGLVNGLLVGGLVGVLE
jgi:hypothetical protein